MTKKELEPTTFETAPEVERFNPYDYSGQQETQHNMLSDLANNPSNTLTSLTKSHTEFVVFNNRFEEEKSTLARNRSTTNTKHP